MLKIAICDDEQYYRNKIHKLLDAYLNNRQLEYRIDLYLSGDQFLCRKENAVQYDIVFMDINMEKVNGIQTALQIRSFHSDTFIVFVTAFISYALEGYKVNAVRYIMKDTLNESIAECMDAILNKMSLKQVAFSFTGGGKKLFTDNIIYIESRKHKSYFFYIESEIVTYQIYDKLDHIEQQLSEYGFLRIHKSYLVNMKHIAKVSNYTAFLDVGKELPIPRLKYQTVKEAYAEYKGAM